MENPNQTFQDTNGMSVSEAKVYIRQWVTDGQNAQAIDGCKRVLVCFPDDSYAKATLTNLSSDNVFRQQVPTKKPQTMGDKLTSSVANFVQDKGNRIKQMSQNTDSAGKTVVEPAALGEEEIGKTMPSENERAMGALGWVPLFGLIPLFVQIANPSSLFVQFHAWQGVTLSAFLLLFRIIVIGLLSVVMGAGFLDFIFVVCAIVLLGIYGYAAYQGKWWQMPVIYGMSAKLRRMFFPPKPDEGGE